MDWFRLMMEAPIVGVAFFVLWRLEGALDRNTKATWKVAMRLGLVLSRLGLNSEEEESEDGGPGGKA